MKRWNAVTETWDEIVLPELESGTERKLAVRRTAVSAPKRTHTRHGGTVQPKVQGMLFKI